MIKASILDRAELKAKINPPGIEPETAGAKSTTPWNKPKESMTQRLKKYRAAATAANEDDETKPRLPLSSFLFYVLVIFPITEVRFAGIALLIAARKRNLEDLKTYELDEGSNLTDETKWKLKPGIKLFLLGSIGGFRMCFLPLWLSILCVEFLVGAVVYGLLSVILEVNPLEAPVDELRKSTLLSLHGKVE